nr:MULTISPECIES: 2-C-methyl-D-erythritol 4-phosphate cytidylyltransferase [Pelosinus]
MMYLWERQDNIVVTVIIPAAGQGKRMMRGGNKVFLPLVDMPVLLHSVLTFSACSEVDNLVIVVAPDEVDQVQKMLCNLIGIKPWKVVAGGRERQHSIANAIKVVPNTTKTILVHDGARPLITEECITNVIQASVVHKAAVVAVAVKNTIKTVDEDGWVTGTLERHKLWSVQTPQGFDARLLRKAYEQAEQDNFVGTDDASLVERLGVRVKIVCGCYDNLKVTTPEDLTIAEALLKERKSILDSKGCDNNEMMRVGMGYDVHKLVENRKLILGGVEVPYELGLDGHSDADVLLHAIKDALLGAAALGDIGRHFPDTDMQYKGVSSLFLLKRVGEIIAEHGYLVHNLDATIVAQRPKVAMYIPEMNCNIAAALGLKIGQINVKATTTEGLGFAGKGEGIAAYAVASILQV